MTIVRFIMKQYAWVFDPHSKNDTVPSALREPVRRVILKAGDDLNLTPKNKLDVRFRGAFCYVDAFEPNDPHPTHLFRLRYSVSTKKWTVALFAYSNESYVSCNFPSGDPLGQPEEAMPLALTYL